MSQNTTRSSDPEYQSLRDLYRSQSPPTIRGKDGLTVFKRRSISRDVHGDCMHSRVSEWYGAGPYVVELYGVQWLSFNSLTRLFCHSAPISNLSQITSLYILNIDLIFCQRYYHV